MTFELGEIAVDPNKSADGLLKATCIDVDTTNIITCNLPSVQRTNTPMTFTRPYFSGGLTYYKTNVDGSLSAGENYGRADDTELYGTAVLQCRGSKKSLSIIWITMPLQKPD